jgi:hypothetical protein
MKAEYFDGIGYLQGIANVNKVVKNDRYKVGLCSGAAGVEDVIGNFRSAPHFFLVDNTTNGRMVVNNAGGVFNRRTFTVFIIKHYRGGDMQDYESKMSEVRLLYLQILSRLLRDRVSLELKDVYLRTDDIYYREPGPYGFNGSGAGMYFTFPIDEPTDLIYDNEQWTD